RSSPGRAGLPAGRTRSGTRWTWRWARRWVSRPWSPGRWWRRPSRRQRWATRCSRSAWSASGKRWRRQPRSGESPGRPDPTARAFRGGQRPRAELPELTLAGLERPRATRVLWRMRWEAVRSLATAPFRPPERLAPVVQPPRDPRVIYVVDDDPDAREALREQL